MRQSARLLNMRIVILRGIHDKNMAKDILPKVEDCDVILFEALATKDSRRWLSINLKSIAKNPNRISKAEAMAIHQNSNPYIQMGLLLHSQGKHVFAVDKAFETEDELNKYLAENTQVLSLPQIESFLLSHDLHKLYQDVEANIREDVNKIMSRDALVASQTKALIDHYRTINKEPKKIAIIQGYFHNLEPKLRQLIPDAEITTESYNTKLIDELISTPYSQALTLLMNAPNTALDRYLIARNIYVTLKKAGHGIVSDPAKITSIDVETDENIQIEIKYSNECKEISDQDIQQVTNKLIKETLINK